MTAGRQRVPNRRASITFELEALGLTSRSRPAAFEIVGDCSEETVCVQCNATGNVKKIARNQPGAKSETLHIECARFWFRCLNPN